MKRSASLARLGESYDVLVIGGGATGLGVAVDSASRGYSTLLVEARDFAQGTSSRSTKLVHGGVRYLQQGNVRLVREALHERGRLLHNAPHLVHELRFLVPTYSPWRKVYYGAGLKLYEILAGKLKMTRVKIIGSKVAENLVPTIQTGRLNGGILYSDGQFNDSRLAISLARTATEQGAVVLNYSPVVSLTKTDGRVSGATIRDDLTGAEHTVRARAVVNATGVFTDAIRRMDDPDVRDMLAVSQGIHIVLDRRFLPGDTAIMIPRTEDGRVVFIIPWQGRTLAGTTDTPVKGPSIEPTALDSEVEFILKHVGTYLQNRPTRGDVLSIYSGLRPLVRGKDSYDSRSDGGGATSRIRRDHTLIVSGSGLLTITGGKWTTYRRMAEDAVDHAAKVAGLPDRPCITASLRLHGANGARGRWRELGATEDEIRAFESRYPGELHPRLPYSLAMVAYVVENEMPMKLQDVLSRRLRALLLDADAAIEAAPAAAWLMASIQGCDDAWIEAEIEDFTTLARGYTLH